MCCSMSAQVEVYTDMHYGIVSHVQCACRDIYKAIVGLLFNIVNNRWLFDDN